MASELERLQRRFFRLVAQPEPVDTAAQSLCGDDPRAHPLAGWIAGGDEAHATARLSIYANMYFARHHEALRESLALTASLAGDEPFAALAAEHLTHDRSASPALDECAGPFAAWLLGALPRAGLRPDLGCLAALEAARRAAFVAADAPPLRGEALAEVPADAWPDLGLVLVPSARLIDGEQAVAALWSALDRGLPAPPPCVARETLLVWRRGFTVFHRTVADDERRALVRIAEGAPFALVCEPVDDAERALELLQQWLVDELLAAPTGPGATAPRPASHEA